MCKNTGIRLSVLELSKGAVLYVSFHSWPLNKVRFQRLGEGYKSPLFYEHGAGKFPFLKMSPEKKIHIHIQFHARSIVQIENLEEVLVQGAGVCYWLVLMSECQEVKGMAGGRVQVLQEKPLASRVEIQSFKRKSLSDEEFPL